MKKFIVLLVLTCFVILLGLIGGKYISAQRISLRETLAQNVMTDSFAKFSQTWDLSFVPIMFVDGAQMKAISQNLLKIKEALGSCSLNKGVACTAGDRNPEKDAYFSKFGHAVTCRFVLTCEKTPASGLAIFYPLGNEMKIYRFELSTPEE